MKLLLRFKLFGPFFVPGALSSQPQLQQLIGVRAALLGWLECAFDYLLHVDTLCADYPPSNLKLLLILDLNIVPAGKFALFRIPIAPINGKAGVLLIRVIIFLA